MEPLKVKFLIILIVHLVRPPVQHLLSIYLFKPVISIIEITSVDLKYAICSSIKTFVKKELQTAQPHLTQQTIHASTVLKIHHALNAIPL